MAASPTKASSRKPSKEEREQQAKIDRAFRCEQRIRKAMVTGNKALWELAKATYELHESGGWTLLGYDSLEDFIGQPEIGMRRSQFFSLSKLWRDMVEVKKLPLDDLKQIEPSRVKEVAPAIMRGDVKPSKALADAKALSVRDLRTEYARNGKKKVKASETKLAAEDEPEILPAQDVDELWLDVCTSRECGGWVALSDGDYTTCPHCGEPAERGRWIKGA